MPLYEFQCLDCGSRDQRLTGLDDHTAICNQCGGLMLRPDEDVFKPYFREIAEPTRLETNVKDFF